MSWLNTEQSGVCRLTQSRIILAVAAWAYENNCKPIMSDSRFDELALEVESSKHLPTNNPTLDRFFAREFEPYTGLWVWNHPDPQGLENIYFKYFAASKIGKK